jgi:hypothetical protein
MIKATLWTACLASVAVVSSSCIAQNPTANITNGKVKATLYLPDSKNGYYRGTRFDWSGVVASLDYAGHHYYGPWYDRADSSVSDFTYDNADLVTGPCSSIMGVPEEFSTDKLALGWDEAKEGGTFIKIVDGGKWNVRQTSNSVEFTQELSDPTSGYAYVYRKSVSLTPGRPQMVLEHSLRNTGRRAIRTAVYDHNFLRIDNRPPNPDMVMKLGFEAHPVAAKDSNPVEVRGDRIILTRPLSGKDTVRATIDGFGAEAKDYDFSIEDRKLGAGVRATGDRPLSNVMLWGIRSVISLEPFIAMTIEPGAESTWKITYDYYTLPKVTP